MTDAEKNAVYNSWRNQRAVRIQNAREALPKALKDFLGGDYSSPIWRSLCEHKNSGGKPSEFIERRMSALFGDYIRPEYKRQLLWAADNITSWQYSQNYWRRSYRSSDYCAYPDLFRRIIESFERMGYFESEPVKIVTGDIPEMEKMYMERNSYYYSPYEFIIPAELDSGSDAMLKAVEQVIMGEGTSVTTWLIRGVFRSRNRQAHELLGKLLLAARLQEGVRQAICENADCGTREGLVHILRLVTENDLIRFSSVKRAAATWCGLPAADPSAFDRIAEKTVRLMNSCLNDPAACEKYLKSEDAMELYIALWAYSFDDAVEGMKTVRTVLEQGTHHQRLVCGAFAKSFDNGSFENLCGKYALSNFSGEADTMAVFIDCLMPDAQNRIYNVSRKMIPYYAEKKEAFERLYVPMEPFFDSEEEARKIFEILKEMYSSIPKKELKFEPCVFPWNTAVLSKSDIISKMAYIASALKDNALMDEVCGKISEISSGRAEALVLLTAYPETETQQKAVVAAIADRETHTSTQAYKAVSETVKLNAENYLQIENMLKYKSSDIRKNAIALLLKQEDKALLECCQRLLSDKNSEKRTGGLDIVMQIKKNEKKTSLFEELKPAVAAMSRDVSKEQILIEEILGGEASQPQEGFGLYKNISEPLPEIDMAYIEDCRRVFGEYFPEGCFGKKKSVGEKLKKAVSRSEPDFVTALKKLDALIAQHANDEYVGYNGEAALLGSSTWLRTSGDNMAFLDMWLYFYDREIGSPRLLERMRVNLQAYVSKEARKDNKKFMGESEKIAARLFGEDMIKETPLKYGALVRHIISALCGRINTSMFQNTASIGKISCEDETKLAAAAAQWLCQLPENEFVIDIAEDTNGQRYYGDQPIPNKRVVYMDPQITTVINRLGRGTDPEYLRTAFPIRYALSAKSNFSYYNGSFFGYGASNFPLTDAYEMLRACALGIVSDNSMYKWFFTRPDTSVYYNRTTSFEDVLTALSTSIKFVRERDKAVSTRTGYRYEAARAGRELIGKDAEDEFTEDDLKILNKTSEVYNKVIRVILDIELKRGDSETQFSKCVRGIKRIYGAESFVRILAAMGKDTFDRSTWYSGTSSKKESLSHLISVCVPDENDNAEILKKLVKATDITEKRLIEAAMYSPEWIDIIEEYLGWEGFRSGCYYFMAHMNERFDPKREAVIAKYSPLSPEELQSGAFDIGWFKEAHSLLDEKRFKILYDAAKYISDGAKHSRARKYADAVMGKLDETATQKTIDDKRNKDLLMAYSLIPVEGEEDIMRRYLFLQKFLKESKNFGAQRRASESAAVDIAMKNLATAAGLSDVTRLKLRMETRFFESIREQFRPKEIGEVKVWLEVTDGKTELKCEKGGKLLKSVPAKLKKDPYVTELAATKKQLTEQYRRTRIMLEQSMEDRSVFTLGEINMLKTNPVAAALTEDLVYAAEGKCLLIRNGVLVNAEGEVCCEDENTKIVIAHPIDMYSEGTWRAYQKYLFDNRLVQPFRQVFRELYIKTDEELECFDTRRYAGNQIQVKKTVACLKSRRWVCDVEDGLQKVYFKENLVAKLYALADWFSPSDIEAPTLEWVGFFDRKTGKPIHIKDIPDIIFSEVMRDADLAVSVCHAGEVDPEHSHSTIEMRRAILEFTLPLFKLSNCEVSGSHVFIKGSRGDYSVHLGSGVCHLQGGAMLNILPVHSQHRGRIFLPFTDDDPKTAEVISKVLLLAEDNKIKDPYILSQIGG